MENQSLIEFAEEQVAQFKYDLLIAQREGGELAAIMVNKLNDKKNDYWDEIMDTIKIHTEKDNLDEAYKVMSNYHAQFQSMLEGFIQNKCSANHGRLV